jgi:hypothetical protein
MSPSRFFERKRDMERESTLSLLAAQISCATSKAMKAREVGRDASAIEKIAGSLRLTLAASLAGLPPDEAGPQAFQLAAGRIREHSVVLGDRPVPLSGPYLESLLHEAGLELAPGQVILLEAELVRDLVEEALGRVAHEQARVEKERAELEAVLARSGSRVESVEHAIGDALAKRDEVCRRKAALVAAGLALGELGEQKGCP